jgi:hypothetical protein
MSCAVTPHFLDKKLFYCQNSSYLYTVNVDELIKNKQNVYNNN